MASLASWTSLGTLSWRTTCEVLVGPHRIQSCWPLVPLLTQCSGVSLFMTRRCRPTRGPFCRLWRIVATTRGPCYTHRSMLELFIVPVCASCPSSQWFLLFGSSYFAEAFAAIVQICDGCFASTVVGCGSLPNGYLAAVDIFSSECFVADVSMVFPMVDALPPSSLWVLLRRMLCHRYCWKLVSSCLGGYLPSWIWFLLL